MYVKDDDTALLNIKRYILLLEDDILPNSLMYENIYNMSTSNI